jgi:phosphatidylglycerophosphate synthase
MKDIRERHGRYLGAWVFRPLSIKIAKRLAKTNITPNQITFLEFLLQAVMVLLILTGEYNYMVIGSLLIPIIILLDHIDGSLARMKKTTSELGKFFDSLAGQITDFLPMIAVFYVYLQTNSSTLALSMIFIIIINFYFLFNRRFSWVKTKRRQNIKKRFKIDLGFFFYYYHRYMVIIACIILNQLFLLILYLFLGSGAMLAYRFFEKVKSML